MGAAGRSGPAACLVALVRALRDAGLALGAERSLLAVQAAALVGMDSPERLYWALHAVCVRDPGQRALFARVFAATFGEAAAPEAAGGRGPAETAPVAAVLPVADPGDGGAEGTGGGWSARERLARRDFARLAPEELAHACRVLARLRPRLPAVASRRRRADPRGRGIDLRASLRASMRAGPAAFRVVGSRPRRRPLPLVLLCDCSGSMAGYTSPILHLAYALLRARAASHCFVFATRLSPVTGELRARSPGAALAALGAARRDWSGGTRLAHCLGEFNRRWARRVLTGGAVVLLFSDGLDGDRGAGIAREAARLRRSCRRLIWLNPLLRYDRFDPRALGVRALLAEVDEMRPMHDLDSLEALIEGLAGAPPAGERPSPPARRPG